MNGKSGETLSADLEVQVVDENKLFANVVQRAHRDLVTQTKEQIRRLESELQRFDRHSQREKPQSEEPVTLKEPVKGIYPTDPSKTAPVAWRRRTTLSNRIRHLQDELAELEAEEANELSAFSEEVTSTRTPMIAMPSDLSGSKRMKRDEEGAGFEIDTSGATSIEISGGLWVQRNIYEHLFTYQREALTWLWSLHVQGTGGILGDEMGLGKTIQIIAFLAALDFSGHLKGPVLIVAPVTVLDQWRRELRAWWPQVYVQVLHAVLGDREPTSQHAHSRSKLVLITNYEHLRLHADWFTAKPWDYVVLDEGHRIRNPEAEITQVCKRLNTVHRIIMTGAPLQNRLCELWSLFDFAYPGRLGTMQAFEEEFSIPISMGGFANATPNQVHIAYRCAATLRDHIAPYLLRRLKREVALQLPQKQEHVLLCRMTEEQKQFYKRYLASIDVERAAAGQLNLLPVITTLRKICNHPRLAENDLNLMKSERQLVHRSGSGKMVALERLLEKLHEAEHRVLIFSQTRSMLSLLEKSLQQWSYSYLRMDGETNVALRAQLVDCFNNDRSLFAFLLTTRVGGLGLNLTGADRVIIYDPDWNPTSDTQARERAWRIGQERPVAVYRLLTRGTIEEKIYHRQIFKTFLSEKVLHDPRKRRFFKRRDIQELLTLNDDSEDDELMEISSHAQERSMQAHKRNDASDDSLRAGQMAAEVKIMRQLLDKEDADTLANVTAVMNHDSTQENSGRRPRTAFDRDVVHAEAERIAQRAVESLRRSVNGSSTTTHVSVNHPPWIRREPTLSQASVPLASHTLLQGLQEREAINIDEQQVRNLRLLAHELVTYLRNEERGATTAELARRFKNYLRERGINTTEFRAILKRVAYLDENEVNGGAIWRIRPSTQLSATFTAP
ncbi:hypothetical protein CCYA_CCYA04G1226 [Cyanidiococcus yangmingshanensis]|nr:hypothetical protein CCYA_CCYA04G1226 [Cyanidiococcus yangmingshanensis]